MKNKFFEGLLLLLHFCEGKIKIYALHYYKNSSKRFESNDNFLKDKNKTLKNNFKQFSQS